MAYLDSSDEGKKAVEEAFNAQADALTGLAHALRSLQTENVGTDVDKPAEAASVKVTQAVEGLLQLPPEQGKQAVEKAASVLGASFDKTNAHDSGSSANPEQCTRQCSLNK